MRQVLALGSLVWVLTSPGLGVTFLIWPISNSSNDMTCATSTSEVTTYGGILLLLLLLGNHTKQGFFKGNQMVRQRLIIHLYVLCEVQWTYVST